jgi:hypothetical protein
MKVLRIDADAPVNVVTARALEAIGEAAAEGRGMRDAGSGRID